MICGGGLIVVGNAMLASGTPQVFFLGLTRSPLAWDAQTQFSALVGNLYPKGGSRRDAGFSLFYMGINVGALLGALLVPICAVASAGTGALRCRRSDALRTRAVHTHAPFLSALPKTPVNASLRSWLPVLGLVAAVIVVAALSAAGTIVIDAHAVATRVHGSSGCSQRRTSCICFFSPDYPSRNVAACM